MNYRLYVMFLNDLVVCGTNPSRTSFSLQGLLGPSTTMVIYHQTLVLCDADKIKRGDIFLVDLTTMR